LVTRSASALALNDTFVERHVGPSDEEIKDMLQTVGCSSLEDLSDTTVPGMIRLDKKLELDGAMSETEALAALKAIMSKNEVKTSFIGMGYYETTTPSVILRNMLENPGWYTAYTPYQAEISQGRLEMLLNYQTMVTDLTGLPMANASLLDEATAAAEAMSMCTALTKGKNRNKFFVSDLCHPQTIALIETRANAVGIEVVIGKLEDAEFDTTYTGALVQYPDTRGSVVDLTSFTDKVHAEGALVVAATDLLALTVLKPPGEWGADIAVGSAQRFGVPMGFGGPHAAFMATSDKYSRRMPGRIIGVTIDSQSKPALRMAMQTREQHIRRDKATSNICTAQALLANMAASYGIYHGKDGLVAIADRTHKLAAVTAAALKDAGYAVPEGAFFDTITVDVSSKGKTAAEVQAAAAAAGCNVREIDDTTVGISMGEPVTAHDLVQLLSAFDVTATTASLEASASTVGGVDSSFKRTSEFLTHPVFNSYRSESQMMRFLRRLENKDLSLNHSMISLGSCTMKLNAASEMLPVTWETTARLHPFAPKDQVKGYYELIESLNSDLAMITGFDAVSAQPNSGATGEFAGLLCIKDYQEERGQGHRNICLIPVSAHGTNPASAVMAGMKVVTVKTLDNGDIDFEDLSAKVEKHSDNLAALMVTYPSTYGVFEEGIVDICDKIHDHGGQVYMDGANMNAQVGLTAPGFIGADVCHLNLHKTFCIPHGGGGPGVGSIGVKSHLAPFLPGHAVVPCSGEGDNVVVKSGGAIAAAPFGSAAILPISWMYIKMLGEAGLTKSTQVAILNANYMSKRLEEHFPILFRGKTGMCAHEFIMDLRPFKEHGIVEEDIAKRLQDYGFHSPTMSWPVSGTLMIEPTESEDQGELDRFCNALIAIRGEIDDVASGRMALEDSPLHHAPHTMGMVMSENWDRAYSRETAAFPGQWLRDGSTSKHWPTVGRVDNVYGDRNLVCTCPPMSVYEDDEAA